MLDGGHSMARLTADASIRLVHSVCFKGDFHDP